MERIYNYIEEFNNQDTDGKSNLISNSDAYEWIINHVPLLECPDSVIEKVYYYRWWVYRKHIKQTPDGYVVTEFLPNVPWAGKYNTINAPVGHHIAEGRWIYGNENYIKDDINFWIDQKGSSHSYSAWLISAVLDYCRLKGDFSIGTNSLDKLIAYYKKWEDEHLCSNGMFWSIDGKDAMEYSISGTSPELKVMKGFRPTLNSYMAADALALASFAHMAGRYDVEEEYTKKAEKLKELIIKNLWDGDFFKAIHCADKNGEPIIDKIPSGQNARELIGYIPWCFDLPPKGMESAFSYLKSQNGFYSDIGPTTAEQSHPRFLYEADHECLWNGYVWPFATSQTLNAVSHLLKNYNQTVIDKNDFYSMLLCYAKTHHKTTDSGKDIMWIDEVLHPKTGEWYSEKVLKAMGFPKEKGGFERGKDYNHSSFCDIVLGSLLGIGTDENLNPCVNPLIPDSWEYFKVDNAELAGKKYLIIYDKNGTIYNIGKGITVIEKNK